MKMAAGTDDLDREFGRHQVEVGTVARHHRSLSGVVDEYRNRARRMSFGLHEPCFDHLAREVFLGQLTEAIASDLADESRWGAVATRPHRDVGRTSTWREHHFAERVATVK